MGKGYVFAIGDPWIYNEYIDHDRLPEVLKTESGGEPDGFAGLLSKVK